MEYRVIGLNINSTPPPKVNESAANSIGVSKKFLENEGFNINFEACINDEKIEDFILNDRIDGVKKFKVNATPTIIINDKKFEKTLNYKNLKKALEKLI